MRGKIDIKRFTLFVGIAFILVAIAGFIPGLNVGPHAHDPSLTVESSYGGSSDCSP